MQLFVHIGQPKTGSSTLQAFFNRNRETLLAQGYLYPKTLNPTNHGDLTVEAMGRVQRSLVPRMGGDFDAAAEKSKESWRSIAHQIKEYSPKHVIISSEFFFAAKHSEKLKRLIDEFIQPSEDPKFIAYMRTPSEHYVSLLQQAVKASHTPPMPKNPGLHHLNRYSSLGSVEARKFSRNSLVGNDIILDACHAMGIEHSSLSTTIGESNTSISAEGIILLQRYRHIVHPNDDNVFTKDTQELLRRIIRVESKNPESFTKAKLKPRIAQHLDSPTDITESLKSNYGIDISKDHGIPAHRARSIKEGQDITSLLDYKPNMLEKLTKSVRINNLISVSD